MTRKQAQPKTMKLQGQFTAPERQVVSQVLDSETGYFTLTMDCGHTCRVDSGKYGFGKWSVKFCIECSPEYQAITAS